MLKSLPSWAKIAVPAVIGMLIILVVFKMMAGGDGTVFLTHTSTADELASTTWKLKTSKVTPTIKSVKSGGFDIRVPETSEATAKASIQGTQLDSRLGKAAASTCKEPGTLGSTAQQDRFAQCYLEYRITNMAVKTSGVMQAIADVNTEDSGALLGSDKQTNVSLTLFPLSGMSKSINAAAMAEKIANMVPGGSTEHVIITDAAGNIMWSKTNSGGSASGASGGTCSQPSDQVVDITTKEQQVSDCIESQIKTQIAQLVGSSDHVVATATVTLNPSATSTSVNALSKGALVTKSETKSNGNGAGNDSTDLTNQPGTKHIQTDTMAGNIKGLAIAVTLDSRYVSPALEAAVRDQLAPYYNKARGDAAPNVRSAPFATPADTTTTTTTGGATGSPATTAAPLPKNDVPITQSTHIPTSLTVMVGVLLLGLVSMIALLWRRSGKDRGERERLEREFSTEHNMFMNFAQEDPDALAREMEAMMGAPTPRS